MKAETREALLTKAWGWIDDIRLGRIGSCEAQGERHIRVLDPLAFLSPRIIAAIGRPFLALCYPGGSMIPPQPVWPLKAALSCPH
jgi:hypothetical protein